jgi:hypothetical protein
LDNRQLALAVWIVIAIIFIATRQDLRSPLRNLLRSFFAWKLVVAWLLMSIYIWGETRVLERLGIWDQSHVLDTVLWGIAVAVVTFAQLGGGHPFKQLVLQNFQATVILDFLVNLYVFNLAFELLFIPFMFVLGGLVAVAESKAEYRAVVPFLQGVTTIVGASLLGFATYNIYFHFTSFASIETVKEFAVPPALSLLFIPFLYLALLVFKYERMLNLVDFLVKDRSLATFVKWQAVLRGNLNAAVLDRWGTQFPASFIKSREEALAFFARPATPIASPPTGFRSMVWGEVPSPRMRKLANLASDECELYAPEAVASFLGLPVVEETLLFSQGRFCSGTIWVDGPNHFETLEATLSKMYGPPTFKNPEINLMKWTWRKFDREIELYCEPRVAARTSVTYRDRTIN